VEAAFTEAEDFAEREKDGIMGNFQYIADWTPIPACEAFGSGSIWSE
jgi:hypothetical protein